MSEKKGATELGDHLIELLFDLGWSAGKIRDEAATLHRQIGGPGNEEAFVSEIERARADRNVRDPFAYALTTFQRSSGTSTPGPRTSTYPTLEGIDANGGLVMVLSR